MNLMTWMLKTQWSRVAQRAWRAASLGVCALGVLTLSACGGGGGGSSSVGSGGGGSSSGANVAPIVVDSGPTLPANYVCTPTEISQYKCGTYPTTNSANIPYITIKVCLPGTTNCMTIDHVSVDTGSSGLRLQAGAIAALTSSSGMSGTSFLAAMPGTANASGAGVTAECVQFGSGYTFGPVASLDVVIATNGSGTSEKASAQNVQIVGGTTPSSSDVSGKALLASCESIPSMNDIFAMGGNGILGVGLFVNDCTTGQTCPAGQGINQYFSCVSTGCTEVSVTSTQQVANTVASLVASDTNAMTDTNGVIIALQSVANTGADTATGTILFGVGTRSNNAVTASQTVLLAGYPNGGTGSPNNNDIGNVNITLAANSPATVENAYGGLGTQSYSAYSFIDSGSNGYYLPISGAPCDATYGWYASASTTATTPYPLTFTVNLTAASDPNVSNTNIAPHSTNTTITVQSETNTYSGTATALPGFSAPLGQCSTAGLANTYTPTSSVPENSGVDLGLPFFFGRNIAVVVENARVAQSGTTYVGPLWAF
jgi:hypothetical protein